MQYLRLNDASARLMNCVIQHPIKGLPFYIEDIQQNADNTMTAIGFFTGHKRDKDLIILNQTYVPPPKFTLGYTNVFQDKVQRVVYVSRAPERRTYLGVCRSNTHVEALDPEHRFSWETVILGQSFLNLQLGRFSSIAEATSHGQGALSNEFALKQVGLSTFSLLFENIKIGELSTKENVINLYPPYEYSLQSVQRMLLLKGEPVRVVV